MCVCQSESHRRKKTTSDLTMGLPTPPSFWIRRKGGSQRRRGARGEKEKKLKTCVMSSAASSSGQPLLATVCSGPLLKLGGGSIPRLQQRYFILRGDQLSYWEKENDTAPPKGTIDLHNAKIVFRGTYMGKLCFSIDGRNTAKGCKEYFLFTEDPEDRWRWLNALMEASGRYSFMHDLQGSFGSSSVESTKERLKQSPLHAQLEKRENQSCADCGAAFPTWAVLQPFGAYVCIDCIGVHRGLWAPKCREVQLDKWCEEDIAFMAERGNLVVNEELEYFGPNGAPAKPVRASDPAVRKSFIVAKYRTRTFEKASHPTEPTPKPLLCDAPSPSSPRGPQRKGPPKYIGIVLLSSIAVRASFGISVGNELVAVVTNGFQEVRSTPGPVKHGANDEVSTVWAVPLQIGIDTLQRPVYVTLYDGTGTHIVGTAEIALPAQLGETETTVTVPLTGKAIVGTSALNAVVSFSRLA